MVYITIGIIAIILMLLFFIIMLLLTRNSGSNLNTIDNKGKILDEKGEIDKQLLTKIMQTLEDEQLQLIGSKLSPKIHPGDLIASLNNNLNRHEAIFEWVESQATNEPLFLKIKRKSELIKLETVLRIIDIFRLQRRL